MYEVGEFENEKRKEIGLPEIKGDIKDYKELLKENRGSGRGGGRPPKMKFKNDKEKIKYLEAKIAYMDAENDFLAKLRGLKRE